jgi:hypothetical protein
MTGDSPVASSVLQQDISSWPGISPGTCYAWPLPGDATCATVARQALRDTVSDLGLEPSQVDECILMASELAANTLHAQMVARAGGGGDRLASVLTDVEGESIRSAGPAPRGTRNHRHRASHGPRCVPTEAPAPARAPWPSQAELWLYLRGTGTGCELVCKVFDCYQGWRDGDPPSVAATPEDALGGRGLQIVHELSGGRWGHHPTRARLSRRGQRGKAVWFAVPVGPAGDLDEQLSAGQAAGELRAMLDRRGFGSGLVRDDQPDRDLSILSVRRGLTVWCRGGSVSLTTPWGSSQRWSYADLVEAAEQTVRRSEELDLEHDLLAAQ